MRHLAHNKTDRAAWSSVQALVAAGAVLLLASLAAVPAVGVRLFWNLVIPIIPAVLVLLPGWWRNVCPLGSLAAVAQRLPGGGAVRLSRRVQGVLSLASALLFAAIVPARHLGFDLNGHATLGLLAGMILAALALGWRMNGKSGWCAALCPVHAVEKLYGQAPVAQTRNAHCTTCTQCVLVCPDSIRAMAPLRATPTIWHRIADVTVTGGFVGFVWGWFQVPDWSSVDSAAQVALAYGMPLAAAALSAIAFLAVRHVLPERHRSLLVRVFAGAAISCYYWYRLPALVGLGNLPDVGVLVDLSSRVPEWLVLAGRLSTTMFFMSWLLLADRSRRWLVRPPARQEVTFASSLAPGRGVDSNRLTDWKERIASATDSAIVTPPVGLVR